MMDFQQRRQALITKAQQLQTQMAQAQQAVENTRVELAKVIGQLELIAELERQEAVATDARVAEPA